MKKILILLLASQLLLSVAYASKLCPDPNCDDPISASIKSQAAIEEAIFKEVAEKKLSDFDWQAYTADCLDGMFNFSFDTIFQMPNLNDVCQAVKREITNQIVEQVGDFTWDSSKILAGTEAEKYLGGFKVGGGLFTGSGGSISGSKNSAVMKVANVGGKTAEENIQSVKNAITSPVFARYSKYFK